MDFVVLAAIYRSGVQLLEFIYSHFSIKSIIYKRINIQYRAQGLMAFSFLLWVAVLQVFARYAENSIKKLKPIYKEKKKGNSIVHDKYLKPAHFAV